MIARYAHYTQVEPNEKEAAYWLKAASDSRIAQSAPPSAPMRTGTLTSQDLLWGLIFATQWSSHLRTSLPIRSRARHAHLGPPVSLLRHTGGCS